MADRPRPAPVQAEAERIATALPKRFVDALTTRNISRAALAKVVGCHPNSVSAWASGARQPRLAELSLAARALNVSLDALIAREETPEPGLDLELTARQREILTYLITEMRRGTMPRAIHIAEALGFPEDVTIGQVQADVQILLARKLIQHPRGFVVTDRGAKAIGLRSAPQIRTIKRQPVRAQRMSSPGPGNPARPRDEDDE